MADDSTVSDVPRTAPVTACPLCGDTRRGPLFTSGDRMLGVPGRYEYHRCAGCQSVFQAPRILDEDLGLAYPGSYYTHERDRGAPPEPGEVGRGVRDRIRAGIVAAVGEPEEDPPPWWGAVLARSRWLRERAFRDLAYDEAVPRRRRPGRALDVGCGSGGMLVRLARLGWEPEGLEWDEDAAAAARETGFPVRSGDILEAEEGWGPFRLILLNHVFEHLPDPGAVLRTLRSLLAPHGRIVMVFPNARSLGARRFGAHWFAWEVPRHLVLPSRSGMRRAAREAGLTVASSRTLARAARAHSVYSRAYRKGEEVRLGAPGDALDRAFHLVEAALVALGADVGEASLVTLVPSEARVG